MVLGRTRYGCLRSQRVADGFVVAPGFGQKGVHEKRRPGVEKTSGSACSSLKLPNAASAASALMVTSSRVPRASTRGSPNVTRDYTTRLQNKVMHLGSCPMLDRGTCPLARWHCRHRARCDRSSGRVPHRELLSCRCCKALLCSCREGGLKQTELVTLR